jgi:CRISPR-associated endonuclease/helicase Cas3
MEYYARSASDTAPSQTYLKHVLHVLVRGRCYLRKVMRYAKSWDVKTVQRIYELAAEYHDLGKLDDENQKVLASDKRKLRLPISHADAGVAHLLAQDAPTSALLVFAHHTGLPDYNEKVINGIRNNKVQQHVDSFLPEYLARHEKSVRPNILVRRPLKDTPDLKPPDVRVIFSCLTHADHGDAARASNKEPQLVTPPKLRATERLLALKNYVRGLKSGNDDTARNRLRDGFFFACAESRHDSPITICDAPVGTGKTTSVMAGLLSTATCHKLRRIFVILPFTNIITQSVRVYRKALVLPGEHGEDVVAEIHHRADFADRASRKLTALWDAPIVVTTAVAFFETLASSTPATLRRLQNLPGSAVFLDEAHAMLPARLLKLAWRWIRHAAEYWSCHWVLASGSLCHFWEMEEFGETISLPNIIPDSDSKKLTRFEVGRIRHCIYSSAMTLDTLAEWLVTLEGPVIVVLNTVHTAAAAAQAAKTVFGEGNVLHLSTSLTPRDRETTLASVELRLKNDCKDTKWCLIATSCVEAGVDLSFRTGVRECASLLSLLQLAGRVNRNSEYKEADVWTVILNANDTGVTKNPDFDTSSRILHDFFEKGMPISPALCTEALQREVRESAGISDTLVNQEVIYNFETVEENFKVIDDQAQMAVVDKQLIENIKNYEVVTWREIQNGSVRVRDRILRQLSIQESRRYPGVFLWTAEYSPFLGYMQAVLRLEKIDKDGFAII